MNERDTEALSCLLEKEGLERVDSESEADVLLFNTCSVRDQAERKVFGKVGQLKKIKRQHPDITIGVIGCMAQNYGDSLIEKLPHVDFVVGTDNLHNIPQILTDKKEENAKRVFTEVGHEIMERLSTHHAGKVSSYVSVMRGCNQFCSYCIVPYVRGREKSRDITSIKQEVKDLAAGGTREIFLLGQNITAYGITEEREKGSYNNDKSPFADLLKAINDVEGVERIRFTSPHPKYMNEEFIDTVAALPKVCEHFHVPLQSGSDKILKRMRRGYTVADYMDRIQRIQAKLPSATFSTDIIVGFPGETESDFNATRETMEEVGFDMAYIFKYSPRSGTKAAEFNDDVEQGVKETRNHLLLEDLEKRALKHNRRHIGAEEQILIEGPSKRNQQKWMGRTRTNKVCIFPPKSGTSAGQLCKVYIEEVTPNSLFCSLK